MATRTPTRANAPLNSVSFDAERAAAIESVRRDNAFVAQRLETLRAAGLGPGVTPAAGDPERVTSSRPDTPKPTSVNVELPVADAQGQVAADAVSDIELQARNGALRRVAQRYHQVGEVFHLKDADATVAFRDKGQSLSTKSDDADIARSMVDLARGKGWIAITIKGSKEFKSQVWLYASAQGLVVGGYTPTELDKVKLAELRDDVAHARSGSGGQAAAGAHTPTSSAERIPDKPQAQPTVAAPAGSETTLQRDFAGPSRHSRGEPAPALSMRHEAALQAMETLLRKPSATYPQGHTDAQVNAALAMARSMWTSDRVYVGKVIDQGAAKYQNQPDGSDSYFVKLQDPRGAQFVLWGVDLPRALAEAGAQPGEELVISYKGYKPVTVPVVHDRGEGGRSVEYVAAERNAWHAIPVRAMGQVEIDRAKARAEGPKLPAALAQQLQTRPPLPAADKQQNIPAPARRPSPTMARGR